MRVARISVIALTILAASASIAIACQADVRVKDEWTRNAGSYMAARLRYKVSGASSGTTVFVTIRFHYSRADGWSNGEAVTGHDRFDADETTSGDIVIDTRLPRAVCKPDNPCHIDTVEIIEVHCSD